jgi:hyperosmotically inducible protein
LGRKLLERAQNATEEIGGKLEVGWKGGKSEGGVVDRVEQRLRADKSLDGSQIEVQGNEKELRLRGTVKTPVQRQQAIQVAETTQGVERVSAETLKVIEP